MTDLAIDRFRVRGLSADLERKAQWIADEIGNHNDPSLLLGYLTAAVAIDLERGRFANRDRLAIDLRVIDILRARR